MLKIVHVTAHMGGGVGNLISRLALSDSTNKHSILLLEEPQKKNYIQQIENSIEIVICPEEYVIKHYLAISDIVILHWWHHPLMSKFLYELPLVAIRLILWCHISNLTVPALDVNFILTATRTIFTTSGSYEAYTEDQLMIEKVREKASVVYACGGFEHLKECSLKKSRINSRKRFNIGYMGLVDFAKLHPQFIEYCKSVNIKKAQFIMVGDHPSKKKIVEQAEKIGLVNDLIFKGYAINVFDELAEFDVLGYPLMPYHTCTTENSVLEAMAMEIPPVMLNQLTEKHIIKDGKTGILVSNKEEYGNAMRYLYNNPERRKELGKNARIHVLDKYTLKRLLNCFNDNCETAMIMPKKIMNFRKYLGNSPAEWFVSCLGKDRITFQKSLKNGMNNTKNCIEDEILKTSELLKKTNKSSAFHYNREFPNDRMLAYWCDIFSKEQH